MDEFVEGQNEKDQKLSRFYKREFDTFLEAQALAENTDLPRDEVLSAFKHLIKEYYRQLNKMTKITILGDSAQRKLLKAQEILEAQEIEIKNALDIVKEKESNLKAIFDNAVVGIVMMDTTSCVKFNNNNLMQMLCGDGEHLVSRNIREKIHPEDLGMYDSYMDRLNTGEISQYRIQLRFKRRQAGHFWTDFSVSGVVNERGQLVSIVGVVVDIDDRIKAEQRLKESYQRLKQAQEEIIALERKNSVFAMAVSANHEINQPLMIMKGNLEMLEMNMPEVYLGDKQKRYFDRITDSIDRIQGILNKFKEAEGIHIEDYTEGTGMMVFDGKPSDK